MPAKGEPYPLWPPLLATVGPGARSAGHAHHAMHAVMSLRGELSCHADGRTVRAAGVVTAPDVPHALDASGTEVLLVFLDPESAAGRALGETLEGPVRALTSDERDALLADPAALMHAEGVTWAERAARVLGAPVRPRTTFHPRVRRVLKQLRDGDAGGDTSLAALARLAGLSEGRFMHAFTESVGIPIRPYLSWLKLQRAAAALVAGASLAAAAQAGGFTDAAHLSRSFVRMLGMRPSDLRAAVSGAAS